MSLPHQPFDQGMVPETSTTVEISGTRRDIEDFHAQSRRKSFRYKFVYFSVMLPHFVAALGDSQIRSIHNKYGCALDKIGGIFPPILSIYLYEITAVILAAGHPRHSVVQGRREIYKFRHRFE